MKEPKDWRAGLAIRIGAEIGEFNQGNHDVSFVKEFVRRLLRAAIDEATEWTLDNGKIDAKLSIRRKELYKRYHI